MLCDALALKKPLEQSESAGSSVTDMHAIVVESADQLLWQEVPDIAPGRGEVLIKVAAAGVNRADILQAAGHYPPPPGASELLGMEVSGVVAAAGDDVSDW
jgi:NADPH:quinone reductase-like Zn-dependent oxidoreductase